MTHLALILPLQCLGQHATKPLQTQWFLYLQIWPVARLLDKARFKTVQRKNGKTAVFCDLVLIETPNGQYGDYMVKQSVTKEEREAKVQLPILGNGKSFGSKPSPPPQDGGRSRTSAPADSQTEPPEETDDVPF